MVVDTIYRLYNSTVHWNSLIKKIKLDSILRRSLTYIIQKLGYTILKPRKILINPTRKSKIIVSLTTYPARDKYSWLSIRSLMNQTLPPDEIIIWVSNKQYSSIKSLPKKLQELISFGISIRFVDNDYRSHKKYLYAFKEYPNDNVILVDDDIIYPSTFIEDLTKNFTPNKVHCSYGSRIKYDSEGNPLSYKNWESIWCCYGGNDFFFGSGGGSLFRPSMLTPEVVDIETAIRLCPTADDIWLNTMVRLSNLKIEKVRSGLIFPLANNDTAALHNINNGQNANDIQIHTILREYGNIFNAKSNL